MPNTCLTPCSCNRRMRYWPMESPLPARGTAPSLAPEKGIASILGMEPPVAMRTTAAALGNYTRGESKIECENAAQSSHLFTLVGKCYRLRDRSIRFFPRQVQAAPAIPTRHGGIGPPLGSDLV